MLRQGYKEGGARRESETGEGYQVKQWARGEGMGE